MNARYSNNSEFIRVSSLVTRVVVCVISIILPLLLKVCTAHDGKNTHTHVLILQTGVHCN